MKRYAILMACVLLAGSASVTMAAKRAKNKPAPTAAPTQTGTTAQPFTAPAEKSVESSKAPESPEAEEAYTIKGGQEGAVFKSLTVQGEDRIRFEIERPALKVELDPAKAPGLDWGSARDVLDRTEPDLGAPLVRASSGQTSPYVAHPWLSNFAVGAVARFRPVIEGAERWKLTIVNSRGEAVANYQGRGEPPREIAWDGRSLGGAPVVPGLTYSYVLEAHDRAGNKRNFVGQGFKVSAYRLETPEGPMLAFSGNQVPGLDPRRTAVETAAAPIVIEAATWMNQRPNPSRGIKVTASARQVDEAQSLAARVARQIAPHLLGDPAKIQTFAEVRPDAPEGGTVQIAAAK